MWSSSSSSSTTPSYVELIEPTTQVQVVLLGCLHGSLSSANDVRSLLVPSPNNHQTTTDTVVLELCHTRYNDSFDTVNTNTVDVYTPTIFFEDLQNFASLVSKTNQDRGFFAALLTAVLGTLSILQTNLSGFRSGLEFATAIELAQSQNSSIVLADQDVGETLQRLGKLPQTSVGLLRDLLLRPLRCWNRHVLPETRLLTRAVWGDSELLSKQQQVSMPRVLVRNRDAIQDLLRLLLPPLLSSALLLGGTLAALVMTTTPVSSQEELAVWKDLWMVDSVGTTTAPWKDAVVGTLTEALTLGLGYVLVALPASRVIISERDVVLTEGIRRACRNVAAQKRKMEQKINGDGGSHDDDDGVGRERVVVVLGLLHVNGIAKQLLTEQPQNDGEGFEQDGAQQIGEIARVEETL